ncbi:MULTISPECIES: S10 family peptidase [Rhizobium]|uniref:Carboxypeptidase C (Cathepsin A) n=1 Tax=Rhizobium paranaense TaxID=1650438 RepID=A0A7W8XPK6_9HYPH|nr:MULTISPECIES: carboxypeptidase [Rhizobium]MBB5573181.1 carboxypeptidase C (cathepsin A) [Rhizobium paranaense]PST62217.1 carboxypeptidase [Rhizobium sp. SEMIA4064]
MSFRQFVPSLALVFSLVSTLALAAPPEQGHSGGGGGGGVLSLLPSDAVSDHVLNADGKSIPYTATAGTLDLFGQDGERTAAIFYTAYVAKNRDAGRPITFVFNGGPGAASAFLSLGLVGPRILDFGPSGRDGANAKLVDNPHSWLNFTDLVLIDPVGTGWSRTVKQDDANEFYNMRGDAESLAKAIALYIAHNGRAASPKYILGESYGGLRAAKVATSLRQDQGILISGIVMLSPLIEGRLVFGANDLALGAALELPSLAAAELERKNAFSEQAVEDAQKFALHEYLPTLAGPPPTGDAGRTFYDHVAKLTGIPEDIVAKNQGFLSGVYQKHSDGDGADIVSSYDASFLAPDPYPESEAGRSDDPVLDGFVRAYGGAFSSYARDELGFHTDMTYNLLSSSVNEHWNWGGRNGGSRLHASATDDIKEMLTLVPSFRLLVAQGYSDLITPFSVNKYVLDHMPPAFADRVALKLYRGGHMFYTRPTSREQFTADARTFFTAPPVTIPPTQSN